MSNGEQPIRRPNTVVPTTVMEVSNEYLNSLNDADLISFAENVCGTVFQAGTPRGVVLTKIVNCALAIQDGH